MTAETGREGPPEPAAPFVPMLYDDDAEGFAGVALVHNFGEAEGEIEPGLAVWILGTATVSDARERYEWMLTRPERWAVWADLAPVAGPEGLTLMIEAERAEDVRRAIGGT